MRPSAPHSDSRPIPAKQEHAAQPTVWPGVVIGFGTAVAMWMLWYVLHLPSFRVPPPAAGTVLLIAQIGAVSLLARGLGPIAVRAGLVAGLTAGLINLLLLGSKLTEAGKAPGDGSASLIPSAPLIVSGFLGACIAAGALGGWASRILSSTRVFGSGTWLARFAVIAVVSLVPLITIGGAVTSSGAGMAVPDWPGTYGSNMFLYPIGLMADPYIFLEHTHRLFGTLVGLTMLVLMVAVLRSHSSRFSKALGCAVFLGVCVQGVLGGIRVTEISPAFGTVHGILAQLIFGASVILAVSLTSGWRSQTSLLAETHRAAALSRKLSIAAAACLLIQLTLAALYRHTGSQHALWTHIGFALVVSIVVALLGFTLQQADRSSTPGKSMHWIGKALLGSVAFQFVIGFGAWAVAGEGGPDRVVPTEAIGSVDAPELGRTIIATIHQVNGAFLLALTSLSLGWAFRLGTSDRIPEESGNSGGTPALG